MDRNTMQRVADDMQARGELHPYAGNPEVYTDRYDPYDPYTHPQGATDWLVGMDRCERTLLTAFFFAVSATLVALVAGAHLPWVGAAFGVVAVTGWAAFVYAAHRIDQDLSHDLTQTPAHTDGEGN